MPTLRATSRVSIAVLFATAGAYGYQGSEADSVRQTLLQPHVLQIQSWERAALWSLGLTLAIGILGAVTGVLQAIVLPKGESQKREAQKRSKAWIAPTTLIFGAAIAILTVVNNTVFDTDYRTLRRRVTQGQALLDKCNVLIQKGIPTDQKERDAWYDNLQAYLDKFSQLSLEKEQPTQAENGQTEINRNFVVFADSEQAKSSEPSWISVPPRSDTIWYFVGSATDPALEHAGVLARQNAMDRAQAYLVKQFQGSQDTQASAGALSAYLLRSAAEAEHYVYYDPDNHTFRYYVLMRVYKNAAETDMKVFGLRNRVAAQYDWSRVVGGGTGAGYPPEVSTAREYKIREKHFQLCTDVADLGVYVGDLRQKRPIRVFVFSQTQQQHVDPQKKLSYKSARRMVSAASVLFDNDVTSGQAIIVKSAEGGYSVTTTFVSGDYATVSVKRQ